METECVIICREISNKIAAYECKRGTYSDLSRDFGVLIFRSRLNQDLRYFICSKDNIELALCEISKPSISMLRYCTEIK